MGPAVFICISNYELSFESANSLANPSELSGENTFYPQHVIYRINRKSKTELSMEKTWSSL